jgi:hypothetical protein
MSSKKTLQVVNCVFGRFVFSKNVPENAFSVSNLVLKVRSAPQNGPENAFSTSNLVLRFFGQILVVIKLATDLLILHPCCMGVIKTHSWRNDFRRQNQIPIPYDFHKPVKKSFPACIKRNPADFDNRFCFFILQDLFWPSLFLILF